MAKKTYTTLKDPNSKIPYTFNWSNWLDDGDYIIESSWDVPDGLSEPFSSSFDTTTTQVWLESGTIDETYIVTNHIKTNNNIEENAVLIVKISDLF